MGKNDISGHVESLWPCGPSVASAQDVLISGHRDDLFQNVTSGFGSITVVHVLIHGYVWSYYTGRLRTLPGLDFLFISLFLLSRARTTDSHLQQVRQDQRKSLQGQLSLYLLRFNFWVHKLACEAELLLQVEVAAIEYWGKVYFGFQTIRDKVTILIFYCWCTIILLYWRPEKIPIYSLPSLVTIEQSPGQNTVLNRSLWSVGKKCSCNNLGLVGTWSGKSFQWNVLDTRKFKGKEFVDKIFWIKGTQRFWLCFVYLFTCQSLLFI